MKLKQLKNNIYVLQAMWILIVIVATVVIILGSDKLLSLDKVNGEETPGADMTVTDNSDYSDIIWQVKTIGENMNLPENKVDMSGFENQILYTDAIYYDVVKPISKDLIEEKNTAKKKKMVAFTFDDGPYPAVTNRILDVLEENNAKATFFVIGDRALLYSETIQRINELGCQVANHTCGHKQLSKLKEESIVYEVEHSNALINKVIDVGNVMLRPPYGDYNKLVSNTVKVPMITWSVDSEDWKSRDKDKIIKEVLNTIGENDIILMHDLYGTTADAVEYLVPYLISKGYELVTVEELFERNDIELTAGKVYSDAK